MPSETTTYNFYLFPSNLHHFQQQDGVERVRNRKATGWLSRWFSCSDLFLTEPPPTLISPAFVVFSSFASFSLPPSTSLSDEEEARFNPTVSMDLALSFYYALRRREMTDIWRPTPGISTRGSQWLVSSVEGQGGDAQYIKRLRCRCTANMGRNQGLAVVVNEQQTLVGSSHLHRNQIGGRKKRDLATYFCHACGCCSYYCGEVLKPSVNKIRRVQMVWQQHSPQSYLTLKRSVFDASTSRLGF